jgi:hypothetical protein
MKLYSRSLDGYGTFWCCMASPTGRSARQRPVPVGPLRDASNQIFGLRITVFVIPDPSIRRTGNGIQITWAGDGTGYSLQQSSSV